MNLAILLPSGVLARMSDVLRLVVATPQGAWGILPHRRDCVGVLVPGILTVETQSAGILYIAADRGVFVKTGKDVRISVRGAVRGSDLARLRETVEREYAVLTQTEQEVRHVSEKLESGFLRRMVALHHE